MERPPSEAAFLFDQGSGAQKLARPGAGLCPPPWRCACPGVAKRSRIRANITPSVGDLACVTCRRSAGSTISATTSPVFDHGRRRCARNITMPDAGATDRLGASQRRCVAKRRRDDGRLAGDHAAKGQVIATSAPRPSGPSSSATSISPAEFEGRGMAGHRDRLIREPPAEFRPRAAAGLVERVVTRYHPPPGQPGHRASAAERRELVRRQRVGVEMHHRLGIAMHVEHVIGLDREFQQRLLQRPPSALLVLPGGELGQQAPRGSAAHCVSASPVSVPSTRSATFGTS